MSPDNTLGGLFIISLLALFEMWRITSAINRVADALKRVADTLKQEQDYANEKRAEQRAAVRDTGMMP